jgi:two-component system phosphate regulon sensor histidine kinase PhoR
MDNHAARPEIAEALAGARGSSVRRSFTTHQPMAYAAMPVHEGGAVVGVVRAAVPVVRIDQALERFRNHLLFAAFLLASTLIVAAVVLVQRVMHPLKALSTQVERFADGDLAYRVQEPPTAEVARLGDALNDMAERLDQRLRELTQQRNEREALLASMVESVLAVDREERIITLNRAAGSLLGLQPDEARGRMLQEAIRIPAIHRLAAEALAADHMVETEIVLRANGRERFLQAHGTVLRGVGSQPDAALIVLNDVTHLRSLERMRRDFVANVSHELRTPITTIKGFVETLRDGALDQPEDARRFMTIMERHADRLAAIVEDLLALSRLEEADGPTLDLQATPLRPILVSALDACQPPAAERGIALELECAEGVTAYVDPALIGQAVVNLIDNAVKYSPVGAKVAVKGECRDGETTISVRDAGCGIAAEHLDRIFERFYRVDKARSRELGGTGLGLAIVKHIAQVHGGRVEVESTPGIGSTFRLYLPTAATVR